jgi:hypothetical protein
MATAQETFSMVGNEPLWAAATRCHNALAAAGIPHALVGGVAVCLHGYRRTTVDVDLLVPAGMSDLIRECLESAGFCWDAEAREFRDHAGVPLHLLVAGERAGKGSEVRLPDPGDGRVVETREGLPIAVLARLIEMKLACGEGNIRRTHKDFADVVELIAGCGLGGEFAAGLHKAVRKTYRQLVKNARGES